MEETKERLLSALRKQNRALMARLEVVVLETRTGAIIRQLEGEVEHERQMRETAEADLNRLSQDIEGREQRFQDGLISAIKAKGEAKSKD